MKILDEEERRDLLNDILKDLSKSQDVLSERKNRIDFFIRLESVYHSVGIRKATRSMKGIFPPPFRRYFHSAYVLVRVAQVP